MNIQLEAHIRNPKFLKDGSVNLTFTSATEISDEEVIYLLNAGRKDDMGWILWSPNKHQDSDLPNEPATDDNKTPAKRLRSVLYILWQQQGSRGNFEAFYQEKMEKIIEFTKNKLD